MVDYDNKVKMPVSGKRAGKQRSPQRQLALGTFLAMNTGVARRDQLEEVMRKGLRAWLIGQFKTFWYP
jgi:hypothetical protein